MLNVCLVLACFVVKLFLFLRPLWLQQLLLSNKKSWKLLGSRKHKYGSKRGSKCPRCTPKSVTRIASNFWCDFVPISHLESPMAEQSVRATSSVDCGVMVPRYDPLRKSLCGRSKKHHKKVLWWSWTKQRVLKLRNGPWRFLANSNYQKEATINGSGRKWVPHRVQ